MAAEEVDLVGDHGLVLGAVVDVEVVDARVGPQLACGARRAAAIAGPGLATRSASPTQTQPRAVQRRRLARGR